MALNNPQLVDSVRVSVGDTGVGLPIDLVEKCENSLGLQLVKDLARQIGGSLEIGVGQKELFIVEFVADILPLQTNISVLTENRV